MQSLNPSKSNLGEARMTKLEDN